MPADDGVITELITDDEDLHFLIHTCLDGRILAIDSSAYSMRRHATQLHDADCMTDAARQGEIDRRGRMQLQTLAPSDSDLTRRAAHPAHNTSARTYGGT
jgi:hypothetical protein